MQGILRFVQLVNRAVARSLALHLCFAIWSKKSLPGLYRKPITLCSPTKISKAMPIANGMSPEDKTYHFQGPDPPNPHLQLPLDALDIVELHTLPPAPPRGFAPEEEQLLGHTHGAAICQIFIAFHVRAETGQG